MMSSERRRWEGFVGVRFSLSSWNDNPVLYDSALVGGGGQPKKPQTAAIEKETIMPKVTRLATVA
jgi:hypothetical protein